jgi:hypothetical protein
MLSGLVGTGFRSDIVNGEQRSFVSAIDWLEAQVRVLTGQVP